MSGTGRRYSFNPTLAGLIAGVLIALVIGLMAKINLDFAAPWNPTHTLTAQVTDADGLAFGSDVRIAGRVVGQVTNVVSRGDHTDITFHVDSSDWPLPQDTSANIRLATLLGQKYVQLTPGQSSSQLNDDGVIGMQATQPVVDFDQILNTFDKPTRDALTSLLRTAGASVQGQEGTLQQLSPDLRDLSVHSVAGTGELAKRNDEINNILVNLGVTADQLDASRNDLAGVIDNLNSITASLAQNQSALTGYIHNTDAINQTTDAVLGNGGAQQLNAGLQDLGDLARRLDTLMSTLLPESTLFQTSHADVYARDLVFEIGAATSQSDRSGYFLRQNAAGVDPCGLIPSATPGLCSGSAAPPASSSTSTGTPIPCVAPLPCTGVPTLPTLPGLPGVPGLPGSSTGSGSGSGSGSGGGIPTLPPLPTAFPGNVTSAFVYGSSAAWWMPW